jgi:tetratricopeptide (TPR) repeat protein
MATTAPFFNEANSITCEQQQSVVEDIDENKENITLIWFDPNIGSRKDTDTTIKRLREINDYVKFYTELDQCLKHIQSIHNEKIFLVTSGARASELLPQITTLRQVDSIFIFCMKKVKYEHLTNEYLKIVGIYVDINALCVSIQEQVDLVEKQLKTFSIFDQHQKSTKDLSKQSAEFLWFQLFGYVILRLPRNQHAKKQMLDMCRYYYRGNSKQLNLIDDFDCNYRPELAIQWYSKQSFIYKLINKALRSEDIDQLYNFRFFIGDLSESLAREHQKIVQSEEGVLTVYRGVKLSSEELDHLKENQGKLISTNGYLSTSRSRKKALAFAIKPTNRSDALPVLFEIECDVQQLGDTVLFADIAKFSEYPGEKEVLFDLSAAFRLECVQSDGQVWLIKMSATSDGQAITHDYIEVTRRETDEKTEAIMFGRLMCQMGHYEKSQRYFEQLLANPNGEDVAWIEFNIGRAVHYKDELTRAKELYDRAYDRMMNADPPRIKDSAYVLNNIGNVLKRQEKYEESLQCYRRALMIRQKYCPSGHPDIAISLKNIGSLFSKLGKFCEALDFFQQALEIQEKYYPAGHPDISWSLSSIGSVHQKQGNYLEALDFFQRALNIQEKYYPAGHPDIAWSFSDIGATYEKLNKTRMALDYYKRALSIHAKNLPIKHKNRVEMEANIYRLSLQN